MVSGCSFLPELILTYEVYQIGSAEFEFGAYFLNTFLSDMFFYCMDLTCNAGNNFQTKGDISDASNVSVESCAKSRTPFSSKWDEGIPNVIFFIQNFESLFKDFEQLKV